jgi:hypothetical protein
MGRKEPTNPRFVALACCYWGVGETVEEARRRLRLAGARLSERHLVFELPEGVENVWVDDLGCVRWDWREGFVPAPEEVHVRSRLRVAFVRGKFETRTGGRIRVGDLR